ncbi:MAG: acetyl-CoA carboxylase biotin carboxyl carrier protein subunit [Salinivirgaceae bacterium]|nr:acetyl-CoA carboxylase biotin carboxyl carrier protein subunit [Salinivirgaceae bacterium]
MERFNFIINGNNYDTEILEIVDNKAQIQVNGVVYDVQIDDTKKKIANTPRANVSRPVQTATASAPAAVKQAPAKVAAGANAITAPLPGVILDVKVNVGDTVTVGQQLLTLEAMKMENSIDSTKNGVVKSIAKHKGDSVMEGDVLIEIE